MLQRTIHTPLSHRILFTRDAFSPDNEAVKELLCVEPAPRRVLALVDSAVAAEHPQLLLQIQAYQQAHAEVFTLAAEPMVLPGGESCKNGLEPLMQILQILHETHLDRHSYLFTIGGGAFLDLVGLAATLAHRGIRYIRFPTTTLSQADAGVGVKNGINFFHKKNWLGTFSVPHGVVNDAAFLHSLPEREWRNGLIEAVKVALLKDAAFFDKIEQSIPALQQRAMAVLEPIIQRSAELHFHHITEGGDPFEKGSARPLDFGHWAAHKLEQLSDFQLTHGEAVAIGLALDVTYAEVAGFLAADVAERIRRLICNLGFALYDERLLQREADGSYTLLQGLHEFREHLGGQLSIPLICDIAQPFEAHEMHDSWIMQAAIRLRDQALSDCVA
jgi:3-dehydroquinate synthase